MNFRPRVTGRLLEYKLNRTGARTESLEEGRYVGSPRTGVIAHVHPETSISKQHTHQSGEPIWRHWRAFKQLGLYHEVMKL